MSDFARELAPGILEQATTILDENFRTPEQARLEQLGEPGYWRSKRYTLTEFLKRPSKVWLAERIVGERDLVMIYGVSGEGKTHVVLDAALAFCMGRSFAKKFTVTRSLSVAYCTGEGVGGLADRVRALQYHFEPPTDLQFYIYEDTPQLFDVANENSVLAFLAEWQQAVTKKLVPPTLDVLILDTLHNSAAGSDENSAKDTSIILSNLRMLRDALGCAVILVHHANKNRMSERGSTALRAACDTVLKVQKAGRTYTLTCEKLKDAESWPAQNFQLADVGTMAKGVRVWWLGDASTEISDGGSHRLTNADKAVRYLKDHEGQKFTANQIATGIGLSEGSPKNVYRELKTLKEAGSVSCDDMGKGVPSLWYYEGNSNA